MSKVITQETLFSIIADQDDAIARLQTAVFKGGSSAIAQPTAPAAPSVGTVWIDTDDPVPGTSAATLVTALPGSPVDGQEVYYVADSTNGVIWHLRYRLASPSSLYKWEFVGGSPLYSEDLNGGGFGPFSSSAWGGINAADPAVTVPLPGDYIAEHRTMMSVSASGGTAAQPASLIAGLRVGATEPSFGPPNVAVYAYQPLGSGAVVLSQSRRLTGLAAGTAVQQRYQHNAGTGQTLNRNSSSLTMRPVRVG